MFEIVAPELGPEEPGRRRRPLRQPAADVGAAGDVPAVGAAIHTERLLAVLERRSAMSGQAHPRPALQGPADGAVRRVLAQGRARGRKTGTARGYRGEIAGLPDVEVNFVSSSEIAQHLKTGAAHLGITGEDLIREQMADADERVAS